MLVEPHQTHLLAPCPWRYLPVGENGHADPYDDEPHHSQCFSSSICSCFMPFTFSCNRLVLLVKQPVSYCISDKKCGTITAEPHDGLHPPAEALPMRRKAGSDPDLSIFGDLYAINL